MKLTKVIKYNNVYSYVTNKGTLYAFRYPYYDSLGNRHEKQQRGFSSPMAAHKAELQVEMQVANDELSALENSDITVKEWSKKYYEMTKAKWRPSTEQHYHVIINRYVIPLIGDKKLSKLNRMEYEYLFIDPQLKHLKSSTVKTCHTMFMAIVNSAVANDVIPRNRLHGVKFKPTPKRRAFSETDLAKINDQLKQSSLADHTFFMLLELTGMRDGESLGLKWSDINLKDKTISIKHSLSVGELGPTKTPAGVRTISIPETLVKLLKEYRLDRKKVGMKRGKIVGRNSFVFTFKKDIMYKHFKTLLENANVEKDKYVVYSFRHTHATLLIGAGVSPVDVAKRLGHSDPSVTLKNYAHAIEGNDQKDAELFAKIANV
ncbi:site-specific integrase [Levilactobacillus enshiensis]|uniref:site-specific integrase n=1 Tax=Levilactobacillus enshiensis TaxID=2590213 RepID=UPI00117A90EF|nr:site-specific integrase [Levilactobacillus enshiensis]